MRAAIAALSVYLALATSAHAEIVDFIVDPALTRWSVRGSYFRGGLIQGEYEPQSANSMVTSLTGVIRVDLTPTTIQFLPSSFLDAVIQPLPQQPGPNGAAGAAPADYGMQSTTLAPPLPIFAVRDFGFSISSPTIPLVEFQSGLQFTEDIEALVDARIDYNLGTSSGAFTYADEFIPFDDDHAGSLTTEGLIQRLQLQNYLGDIFALEVPGDSFIEWSGPIVATRVIPEPSAAMLAGVLAAIALIAYRRAHTFARRALHVAAGTGAVIFLFAPLSLSNAYAAEFIFLGETTSASGVSPDGSMVLVSPDNHNFSIWTREGGITPVLSGEIWPRDITNERVVVGLHCGDGTGSCYEAFRWTEADGLDGIGGGFSSDAYGLSADGSVAVGTSYSGIDSTAYRWTSQTGIVPLGNLGGNANSQEIANAVSADGTIIVGQSGSPSGPQAFRWTQATGMVGLGDLPGGDFSSEARAISSNGSVIVGLSNSVGASEAFRWTAAAGMQGLGHVEPGNSGYANAASADGSVIVGRDGGAFYWTQSDGMRSLADLLINDYGLGPQLAGWSLFEARDISDDGRVIIGYGTSPTGESGGWIAIIPEPSAVALALLAPLFVAVAWRLTPIGRRPRRK